MPFPTADGEIATYDQGDGPTVVFLHGTPSGSFEFDGTVRCLPDHRCIRFDHLGFGASDKPADASYDLRAHQLRTAAVLDSFDLEDAVFVLHDFGTSFALPWMLANRERVAGVVLANSFLWPAEGWMRAPLWFYSTRLGRWIYRRFNLSAGVLLPWAWGTHAPLTPEVHRQFLAPFDAPEERWATSSLVAELIGDRISQHSPETLQRWPVEMVWGLADPLVGPKELERWRSALPDAPLTTLDDVGHFVAHEAPESIADAVRRVR